MGEDTKKEELFEGKDVVIASRASRDASVPEAIVNNTVGSVIIQDLKKSEQDKGLHLPPDEFGKPRKVYWIKDMFGDKVLRASTSLQIALEKKLVLPIKEGDPIPIMSDGLAQELEVKIGKIPARRTKKVGEGAEEQGLEGDELRRRVAQHIRKPNIFDERLKDLREELKNDVVE